MDISLGEKLRLLREKRDWTQKQAADIFGITSGALSNYERNKRTPDIHTLKKIAEVYGTSIDYIVDNKSITYNKTYIKEEHNAPSIEDIIGLECLKLLDEIGTLDKEEQKLMALFLEGIKSRREREKKRASKAY
ncbi:MAG TPA: helix-turn-helix transcriptional regulator [Clostridiales bacterium]|nr:helix-turn-helix transcriptional regulator [Clostridiales bacterium]